MDKLITRSIGIDPANRAGTNGLPDVVLPYANPNASNTNSDGSGPYCAPAISGNTLFGTTSGGGTNGNGTVFAVNTDGTGFTNLYTFVPIITFTPSFMNLGGPPPQAGVVLAGGALYGTTSLGGPSSGNVYGLIPLKAQLSGGLLVLSWSGPGFSLYSTMSFDAPFTVVSGATSPYTIAVTNSHEFFRLQASK